MTALYILATTQLLALLVTLDVLWREYHPAVTPAVATNPYDAERADTLVYDTMPVSAAELVMAWFKVVDGAGGRPTVVWA